MWCIPKLNDSEGLIISPVAILSLSTSFFSASFRAAGYQSLKTISLLSNILAGQDNKKEIPKEDAYHHATELVAP